MKKSLAVVVSFMFLGLVGCASTGSNVSKASKAKMDVIETVPRGEQKLQNKLKTTSV